MAPPYIKRVLLITLLGTAHAALNDACAEDGSSAAYTETVSTAQGVTKRTIAAVCVTRVPSSSSYTVDEAESFMNVLDQILNNEEALAGLKDVVDDLEVTSASACRGTLLPSCSLLSASPRALGSAGVDGGADSEIFRVGRRGGARVRRE